MFLEDKFKFLLFNFVEFLVYSRFITGTAFNLLATGKYLYLTIYKNVFGSSFNFDCTKKKL